MGLRYPARRILIRCPHWIGDMVAATAAIRCLRRNYPNAHLALLLDDYVAGVAEHAPWCDELVRLPKARRTARGFLDAVGRLRARPPDDLALLLTHSFSSALLARLSGARRRVGHARGGRAWLLTDAVPWPRSDVHPVYVPKVELYSDLLRYLGCEGAEDDRPEVFTSAEDEAQAERILVGCGRDPARRLLAVVPGAAYGASKLWPPERFAAAADRLAERHGLQALLVTGPGERAIADDIARRMTSLPLRLPEGGPTFGALKALLRRCALMLCNDTGPRHLGIALDLPVVVLMGPTHPAVTHSRYPKTIILRQDVPCGPCYRRRCPKDHRCMTAITTEAVTAAAEDLIRRFGFHEPEPAPCPPSR